MTLDPAAMLDAAVGYRLAAATALGLLRTLAVRPATASDAEAQVLGAVYSGRSTRAQRQALDARAFGVPRHRTLAALAGAAARCTDEDRSALAGLATSLPGLAVAVLGEAWAPVVDGLPACPWSERADREVRAAGAADYARRALRALERGDVELGSEHLRAAWEIAGIGTGGGA